MNKLDKVNLRLNLNNKGNNCYVKSSNIEMLRIRYELLYIYFQYFNELNSTQFGINLPNHEHEKILGDFVRYFDKNIEVNYLANPGKDGNFLSEYFQQRYDSFFDSRLRMSLKGRNLVSRPITSKLEISYKFSFFEKFSLYKGCNGVYHLFQKGMCFFFDNTNI